MIGNGLWECKEPIEEAQRGPGMGTSAPSSWLIPGLPHFSVQLLAQVCKDFFLEVYRNSKITEPYGFLRDFPNPQHITKVSYD